MIYNRSCYQHFVAMNFIPPDRKNKNQFQLVSNDKYLIYVISVFGNIFNLTVLIHQVGKII